MVCRGQGGKWIGGEGKMRIDAEKPQPEIIDGIEITDDMTDEYIAYLRGEIPDPRD